MHPAYEKANHLSGEVIGAAIEVHRHKGSGLIESIYERCLLRELELRSISAVTQKIVRVEYKGLVFDEPLRFDLLVDDCLLIELKAVEILHPSSKAQLFSYMKLLDIPIGLLINFHEPVLKNGISRMILPGANQPEGGGGRESFTVGCWGLTSSFSSLPSVKDYAADPSTSGCAVPRFLIQHSDRTVVGRLRILV